MLLSICVVLFPLNKGCALLFFFYKGQAKKKQNLQPLWTIVLLITYVLSDLEELY